MSGRYTTRLASGLAALTFTLVVIGNVLSVPRAEGSVVSTIFVVAIALVFSAVGAAIASRQPGNAIGWIFLGAAVATGLGTLSGGYAEYSLERAGGPGALGEAAAVYSNVSWIPFILVPPSFLLLLFPDGRLLTRRWRLVAWAAAG